ncbi:mycofactocin system FadH/OYE family oxidoreductase 1 [Rhodococcus sp. BP22]|uniref:mycofactocin system FadH/OYE family oxidoreductase 1 n=1 Tax=Rhodococcus sp. BP22 TaxID=2758566 RepID=UPI0016461255|nr:mycofactocin system FadH/OYE family oxidoreductase 1 [Rhodococcus sp. BP22]
MTLLTEPIVLGGRSAASRVMFGPHETNLADGRAFSRELVEYYRRRAGVGIIVTENASVHRSDWPYERAPLASECGPGWQAVVDACRPNGTLVLAGLTHTGSQGSPAYSREALWGPSHVADVASRELPMEMEPEHIRAAVDGFADAARVAAAADVDGVELDAGPSSLIRQFLSGLTNLREDEYGTDRMLFVRTVVAAVRAELGPDRILALRLSCDEGAPWAGITPAIGADIAREIAPKLDLLTVVRGGAMATSTYRPDFHTEPGFNLDLCRSVSDSVDGMVPVVLQGSIVDTAMAEAALSEGVADIIEMTRALIADPDLVSKSRAGASPRPCILCNQTCLVRDPRNPTVACIGRAGDDPEPDGAGKVLVVGGGPAGLEAARVLALRGRTVTLYERKPVLGGLFSLTSTGEALTDWLAAECVHLGVDIVTGVEIGPGDLEAGTDVVLATGSVPSPRSFEVASGVRYLDSGAVLGGAALDEGPVVVWDPVGGPVAVALAEHFAKAGRDVSVVTVDQIIGRHLSLSGDLAPANVRLQRAGVRRHLLSKILRVGHDGAEIEDVNTGQRRMIECAVVVDCSHRSAEDSLHGPGRTTIGDCLAPRSVAEAIRDGYDAGGHKPMGSVR